MSFQRPVAIIFGTRPEIIKLSSIISELEKREIPFKLIHSNQHYSFELDRIFFQELHLPSPDFNLDVGSGTHGSQTGKSLERIEQALLESKPCAVLVQGDTNTAVAGSLAAVKLHIPVFHIEAGLRSGDRRMPEEINRIVVDHCSDFLFAPTESAARNLLREGINNDKVEITGNTIVDVLEQSIGRADSAIIQHWGLREKPYILVTLHRAENVDDPSALSSILSGIQLFSEKSDLPVIFPVHPRTRKNIENFKIGFRRINLINPVGYLDFLALEKNAKLIITDSGGVQEEACILGVPCVTARENTERPETVAVGANIIAGCDANDILEGSRIMIRKDRKWKNPFGDGKSSIRIVNKIETMFSRDARAPEPILN